MQQVYIVSAQRTPIGSFNGQVSQLSAIDLAVSAAKGSIQQSNLDPSLIQEVFIGNVVSANLGQAPARQVALQAGLGNTVPSTTINKVCASGMKAMMLGAQSIMLGINQAVLTGGMESMSNIPYYIPKARSGYKYGHGELTDGIVKDGLWDPQYQTFMGNCTETTCKEMDISREAQDEYAIQSYQRAAAATENGYFKAEITPVAVPQRKGDPLLIDQDEEFKKVNFDKISTLRPAFSKDGSITAANASTINDGAAVLILVNEEMLKVHDLKPLARIISFADAAQDPIHFSTTPSLAIPKALQIAGKNLEDVDFFEINEAFSAVVIANNIKLNLEPDQVNVFGGAVSLGHPIGCSGARIVTTLINVLHQKQGQTGVAGICNGGGGASALVLEKL